MGKENIIIKLVPIFQKIKSKWKENSDIEKLVLNDSIWNTNPMLDLIAIAEEFILSWVW